MKSSIPTGIYLNQSADNYPQEKCEVRTRTKLSEKGKEILKKILNYQNQIKNERSN